MLPVGFEPTISAGKRPKTYALDHAATGTSIRTNNLSRQVAEDLRLRPRGHWDQHLTITTGPNTNIKAQKGFNKETKPIWQKYTLPAAMEKYLLLLYPSD